MINSKRQDELRSLDNPYNGITAPWVKTPEQAVAELRARADETLAKIDYLWKPESTTTPEILPDNLGKYGKYILIGGVGLLAASLIGKSKR